MAAPLRHLRLEARHQEAGARWVPFAGWHMPLQYEGIVAEHTSVRQRLGLFDVSHLGRVWVRGEEAADWIRGITTYDVKRLRPGRAHYSLYCTTEGGIVDDVFIYHVAAGRWLIVHNAANAAVDFERVTAVAGSAAEEVTGESVMLAVQGPAAIAALRRVVSEEIGEMKLHACREFAWGDGTVLFARTGYTGEDGGECIADPETGGALWEAFRAAGATLCGLGARDTLRLEAALPLHGQDITRETHPFEAGLGFAVSLKDQAAFIGREALKKIRAAPRRRQLGHLRTLERGVLRPGYAVIDPAGEAEHHLGALTSGAFSPMLRSGIGMAYLPPQSAEAGTQLQVEVRGRRVPVEVVQRPFYRRDS